MLSALLPGVREFRTPLVTGLLWGACLWLVVGSRIAESKQTSDFIERFGLDALPPSAWLAAGVLLAYLLGSLLVVRKSPVQFVSNRFAPRIERWIERLDENREPARWHHRSAWKLWQKRSWRRPCSNLRVWAHRRQTQFEPVNNWLWNEFDSMLMQRRVPVMRNFQGGCNAPSGFDAIYDMSSHHLLADDSRLRQELAETFVRAVMDEKPAVEVRMQMRFPEVYAEIDRLKVEAELRMSIFWPLMALFCLLAWAWSPWAILGVLLPPLMLRDGFKRSQEASEKTWGAFMAREVSTPIFDAMESAKKEKPQDFKARFGRMEHLDEPECR